jgi:hypothetical protein
LAAHTGIADRTLRRWWAHYCQAHGLALQPRRATRDDREAFADWLARHGEAVEAAAARTRQQAQYRLEARARREELRGLLHQLPEPMIEALYAFVQEWCLYMHSITTPPP